MGRTGRALQNPRPGPRPDVAVHPSRPVSTAGRVLGPGGSPDFRWLANEFPAPPRLPRFSLAGQRIFSPPRLPPVFVGWPTNFPPHRGSPDFRWLANEFSAHRGSPDFRWLANEFSAHRGSPDFRWLANEFPAPPRLPIFQPTAPPLFVGWPTNFPPHRASPIFRWLANEFPDRPRRATASAGTAEGQRFRRVSEIRGPANHFRAGPLARRLRRGRVDPSAARSSWVRGGDPRGRRDQPPSARTKGHRRCA